MKINKYNVSTIKDSSTTGVSTYIKNTVSGSSTQLTETHLIFGQPFNGTQDVAGDITNANNITAIGDIKAVAVTDDEGTTGGNIIADGNVKGVKFIGDVDAENITAGTGTITDLSGDTLDYNNAEFQEAIINALQSVDITTENLTVTKQAHFFELIIDKIKAAGGAILLTPADGFKVDKIGKIDMIMNVTYRLYWKATDGDKTISNMWKVGDQAICQTFNNADSNYNVSNKYYWALVQGTGTESFSDGDYHYIEIDSTDCDGTLNPEVGDEIAMLGYRGTDDDRQSAIYLAAYNSLDTTLKAPLICHYKGINDYNLSSHKYTWFAANGSEIRGNLKVATGETVTEYVNDSISNNETISQLQVTVDGINSTVENHTTYINAIGNQTTKNTTAISNVTQTANSLKSTVESHTEQLGQQETKISEIEQTAESIRLQVDEVSLKIDNKKIVLDGDTEVNGTVNVNTDGTGFKLNGSSGETFTIGSNDIGSYSEFENKTANRWLHSLKDVLPLTGSTQQYQFYNYCTLLTAGQRFRITNLGISIQNYNNANLTVSALTVSLYKGTPSTNNQVVVSETLTNLSNGYWYQGTFTQTGTKPAIIDYTAVEQGEYYIQVSCSALGTNGTVSQLSVFPICEVTLSAFGNLTYNGFGFNFGAGKVAFISDDVMVFKSNSGLQINDSVYRLVPDSYNQYGEIHKYANSGKWIGLKDYIVRTIADASTTSRQGTIATVSLYDEMLVVNSITNPMIIQLPNPSECAGKSYLIKNYSSSDNVFVAGGTLQTSNSSTGKIIKYGTNASATDTCKITTNLGDVTYYQLLKCYKHSHQLISDGVKWIDNLLSN